MIDKDLLDILACPSCKGNVRLTDNSKYLICDSCNYVFEIKNDTPIMLIDEARKKEDFNPEDIS